MMSNGKTNGTAKWRKWLSMVVIVAVLCVAIYLGMYFADNINFTTNQSSSEIPYHRADPVVTPVETAPAMPEKEHVEPREREQHEKLRVSTSILYYKPGCDSDKTQTECQCIWTTTVSPTGSAPTPTKQCGKYNVYGNLYMSVRGAYVKGNDYFHICTKIPESVNDKITARSVMTANIKKLRYNSMSNVGVALSTTCTTFHRTHIDVFGCVYPWTVKDDGLKWLFEVYKEVGNYSLLFSVNEGNNSRSQQPPAAEMPKAVTSSVIENRQLLSRYLNFSHRHNNSSLLKQVIAMSLYGDGPKYTHGAIRNAQLARLNLPDWQPRFYVPGPHITGVAATPNDVINTLKRLGADVISVSDKVIPPMMWRFMVADDPSVDIFLIYDTDSRLTERLAALLEIWLATNATFYCMRDHRSHGAFAINGGMWSARRGKFIHLLDTSMSNMMVGFKDVYLQDMHFLNSKVWPKVKDDAFCHDSVSCTKYENAHPFPIARKGTEHIGEVYDEFGIGRAGDINIIRNSKQDAVCEPIARLPELSWLAKK